MNELNIVTQMSNDRIMCTCLLTDPLRYSSTLWDQVNGKPITVWDFQDQFMAIENHMKVVKGE